MRGLAKRDAPSPAQHCEWCAMVERAESAVLAILRSPRLRESKAERAAAWLAHKAVARLRHKLRARLARDHGDSTAAAVYGRRKEEGA